MSNGTGGLSGFAPGGGQLAQPGASPCGQGPEKDISIINVQQGQSVTLRMVLCNSPFRLQVSRDQTKIFDQQNLTDEVTVPVPGLTSGNHALSWNFLAAASPWKTRSEVLVDGNLEFARKEGSNSSSFGQLAVFLKVT